MQDQVFCLYHNNRFIGTYQNIQDQAHLDQLVTNLCDCYGYLKQMMIAVEYDMEVLSAFLGKDDPGDERRISYKDLKVLLLQQKPVLSVRNGQKVLDYEYEVIEELVGKEHVFSL